MNYFSILPLSSFIINLVLWVYIFALYRTNRVAKSYLLFLTACGLWALSDFFIWNIESEKIAKYLLHIQSPLWLSTTFFYLNFYYKLLKRKYDFPFYAIFSTVILFSLIAIFSEGTIIGVKSYYWGILPEIGPLYYPALISCVILPVFYFIIISINKFNSFETVLKKQLILSVGGILTVFFASLYVNVVEGFIRNNAEIPALGSTFTSFQVIFIFIAIVKYEFLVPGPLQAANKLFANSSDGVLILDINHKIVEINRNAETFFQVDSKYVLGKDIESIIKEPYIYEQDYDKLEINLSFGDNIKSAVISQIPLLNGKLLIGKLLILHDLTEMKVSEQKREQLEREVKESQDRKMKALGQLAGGIAHDFNNMLNGILGFTNILKIDLKDRKSDLEYLENIENITINAASLTKQMLTFARKNTHKMSTIDICESIKRTVDILSHSINKNIDLRVSCDDKIIVKGEASQIENMLMNLALNSRDAMVDGGILSISAESVSISKNDSFFKNSNSFKEGKYVKIIVSDTGCGMSADTQKQIYEPFFSTKSESGGTGLGLASVYGIVKQHHGLIDVKSKIGKGTSFFIYLPTLSSQKLSDPIAFLPIENATDNSDSSQIMIIDDEPSILKSTSVLLRRKGYTVNAFDDGATGVEHFKNFHNNIHAIILDQTMPGLSGYECFLEFRKINQNIPVILTSGYNSSTEFETLIEDGKVHFLTKPYQLEELHAVLSKIKQYN